MISGGIGETPEWGNASPQKITGVAGYLPLRVLNNADSGRNWSRQLDHGIRERNRDHWSGIAAEKGEATSHLAFTAAAQQLRSNRPILAALTIDLTIITATVTLDTLFLTTASPGTKPHRAPPKAWGFDLSGACSGFHMR